MPTSRRTIGPGRRIVIFAICLLGAALLIVPLTGMRGPSRPNVLWIVWDTARADHMSLYGYERDTTPFLKDWAEEARVFTNCLATAGHTLPSHASLFTGLFPSEHGTHNGNKVLAEEFTPFAEILRSGGYRTFLYSANPYVSDVSDLARGFEVVEHPWNDRYRERATELVLEKVPEEDRTSGLRKKILNTLAEGDRVAPTNIKAAGALAEEALLSWLDDSDGGRPYFAFLNYMEAHRPYIPSRAHRERLMSESEVEASYRVNRSWRKIWEYTFGLREYDDEEIELTRKTYDATLLELDDLFRSLVETLRARGDLENTVIVLTSDHGEHLGEQHMFDHQYSLYQALLHVPLVVHYPERFTAGREDRPVLHYDLFPTLLGLAGADPPPGVKTKARDLLAPEKERIRYAEDPAGAEYGIRVVRAKHPAWDPAPWQRGLRAITDGRYKYILGSDGRDELYDLRRDPHETRNLRDERLEERARLRSLLEEFGDSLTPYEGTSGETREITEEERELLRGLGYVR